MESGMENIKLCWLNKEFNLKFWKDGKWNGKYQALLAE